MPHKLIGLIAIVAMAATAVIEASMVWLVEPLMDETLVAHNLETARWMPFAFVAIFFGRGVTGFTTEASLGWIGRSVISQLRRDVFQISVAAFAIYRDPFNRANAVPYDL